MFIVLRTTSVPDHLRGYLSRFLLEVAAGLYVGNTTSKVAEKIWERAIAASSTSGELVLVYSDPETEQGFRMRTQSTSRYQFRDFDELTLVSRDLSEEI